MHTIMVITGGLVLLAVCLGVGKSLGRTTGIARGAITFIPLWLIATSINMWVGVTKAGYSLAEELPIFGFLFGSLAAIALIIWWKFRQKGNESGEQR